MRTIIEILAGLLILAFGVYVGLLIREDRDQSVDLFNGHDDPGFHPGEPNDGDDPEV